MILAEGIILTVLVFGAVLLLLIGFWYILLLALLPKNSGAENLLDGTFLVIQKIRDFFKK